MAEWRIKMKANYKQRSGKNLVGSIVAKETVVCSECGKNKGSSLLKVRTSLNTEEYICQKCWKNLCLKSLYDNMKGEVVIDGG